MTLLSNSIKVKEPDYFHREYKNDLKIDDLKKAPETVNQGLRVAKAILPFIALYKPVGSALSVVMGGCRAISNASQTYQAYLEGKGRLKIAGELLHTTVAVVSVGCAFFAIPLGMLVTTCHDLAMNCIQLHQAWYEKDPAKAKEMAREAGLQILTNAVYLGLFFTASLEILVASIALQILVGLYQTSGEFQKGNYLEVGAGLLMVAVRMNQAAAPVKGLHQQWKAAIQSRREAIVNCNTAKADLNVGHNNSPELAVILEKYGKDPQGNPPLICAIHADDLEAVKILVKNGADVNTKIQTGCPITAAFRSPNILKFLIDSGANVNIRLSRRETPLHRAVHLEGKEAMDVLNILLDNKADVNALNLDGQTPLHAGIYCREKAIALLNKEANLHIADDKGWKPLHRAYMWGDLELLKELHRRGASLNEFTPDGGNALHHAVRKGDLNLLKWLLDEQKMNVNEWGRWHDGETGAPTPIMWAIQGQKQREDNFELLEFLVFRGADLNVKIHYKNQKPHCGTVLDWSRDTLKCPRYVHEWLIEHGAKPDALKSEISTRTKTQDFERSKELFKYTNLYEAIDKDPNAALWLIKNHVYRPDDRGECCRRALMSPKRVPLELIQICLPSKIYFRNHPGEIDGLRKTALSANPINRHLSHFFTLSNVENCSVRDDYFLDWFKYEFKQMGAQEGESVNDFFRRAYLSYAQRQNFISKCPAEIRDIISHNYGDANDRWWLFYLQHPGPTGKTGHTIKYEGLDKFDLALRYNVFSSVLFYGDTTPDRGIWHDTFSLVLNSIRNGDPRTVPLLKGTFPSLEYRKQHSATLNGYLDNIVWRVCQRHVSLTVALEVLNFLKGEGVDLQEIAKITKRKEIIKFFETHKII